MIDKENTSQKAPQVTHSRAMCSRLLHVAARVLREAHARQSSDRGKRDRVE